MHIMSNFAPVRCKPNPLTQKKMKADYYTIKVERFNQGLTQLDLAKKAKLSLRTIAKAERGQDISPRTNKAIKEALGLK